MVGGLTWLVMLHGLVNNQGKSEEGRRRPVFECRANELGEYIFKLATVMLHSLQSFTTYWYLSALGRRHRARGRG